MSDLLREEFEQRFPVPSGIVWRGASYHREKEKQCTLMSHLFYLGRWETWQASRECLVIELPEPRVARGYGEQVAEALGFNDGINYCEEAIHAAGVKTK